MIQFKTIKGLVFDTRIPGKEISKIVAAFNNADEQIKSYIVSM